MEPEPERLWMYGAPTSGPSLAWSWVEGQLTEAGTYWILAADGAEPHPRPVWGVWHGDALHLSVGSQVLHRRLQPGVPATAHLGSGTDVVIVEAEVAGPTADAELVARYEAKYQWEYGVGEYGPLTTLTPSTVIAWRSGGWAGRDGFQATGRWCLNR